MKEAAFAFEASTHALVFRFQNPPASVAAVLRIAGPTLRRSFELPVKRARSFDRRSNVPGLLICSEVTNGESSGHFGYRPQLLLLAILTMNTNSKSFPTTVEQG